MLCMTFHCKSIFLTDKPWVIEQFNFDINKISGWRLHLQYENGNVALKQVIEGKNHDNVVRVIKTKKGRYR